MEKYSADVNDFMVETKEDIIWSAKTSKSDAYWI